MDLNYPIEIAGRGVMRSGHERRTLRAVWKGRVAFVTNECTPTLSEALSIEHARCAFDELFDEADHLTQGV
jgi:hypothetical protein